MNFSLKIVNITDFMGCLSQALMQIPSAYLHEVHVVVVLVVVVRVGGEEHGAAAGARRAGLGRHLVDTMSHTLTLLCDYTALTSLCDFAC